MKKFLSFVLAFAFSLSLSLFAFASPVPAFVSDGAELLTDEEEMKLEGRLREVSEAFGAQIAVVTEPTLNGAYIGNYAGLFYDDAGYGYGEERAGVLLLVSMEDPKECYILGNGFAAEAVDDYNIELILDEIVPDLTAGNYASSFSAFADECEYYLNAYVNGTPFQVGQSLAIALVIGLIVSFITVMVLKGQLKSVVRQNQANAYVRRGSLKLTQSGDYFLYRNVTRTAKPQNNDSTGSRGGSSRSGGGRRF